MDVEISKLLPGRPLLNADSLQGWACCPADMDKRAPMDWVATRLDDLLAAYGIHGRVVRNAFQYGRIHVNIAATHIVRFTQLVSDMHFEGKLGVSTEYTVEASADPTWEIAPGVLGMAVKIGVAVSRTK
jgi:hypothetical protein